MSKFYTYNAWEETFKPIKNTVSKYPDDSLIHFETYGEEYDFVKEQDPKYVWTEVDGDSGTYIVAGHHFVNRISYYITTNPWTDEMTEVPTWVYRECDCVEASEDGEYDPECEECEEGTVNINCETLVDLKEIYGEDQTIVG